MYNKSKFGYLLFVFLFISSTVFSSDRYWVGGGSSTDWSAVGNTNWSATSGGANNASVPTSSDNVYFDANSGVGTSVISANITIRSLNCTGFTGTIQHNAAVTLSIGDATFGANLIALKFVAGMTYTVGSPATSGISFISTNATAQSIDFGGKTTGKVTYNGANGNWYYSSSHTASSLSTITLSAGTLNTNSKTCSWGVLSSAAGTLTLGSTYLTITGTGTVWSLAGTLNSNTSTIEVNDTSATAKTFAGTSKTFYNIKFSGDNITVSGNNVFSGNFMVNNAGLANGLKLTSTSTQTIIGNFTTNGSAGNLAILKSTVGASAATITKLTGNVYCDYMSIQDITATTTATIGDNLWFAGGNSTNVSGNTGWVFSPLRFWVGGGSGNTWDAVGPTNWSTTSGGANNASVPANTDNVIFNSNSGTGNSVLSADITIRSLNCTDYSGTLTHNTNTKLSIGNGVANGSSLALKFSTTMTYTLGSSTTSSIEFINTVTPVQTIDFGGKTSGNVTYNGVGGSWKLNGNHITGQTATVTLTNGTLDTNGYSVSCGLFNSNNANTRTLTLGSSTITLSGVGSVWDITDGTNLTLTANTSTIIVNNTSTTAKSFIGGGLTAYNNVYFAGDNITVLGSNTFNEFRVQNAGLANGLLLTAGTTQTVTSFTTNGSAGNLAIIKSGTAASAATITKATGVVSVDYMSIQDITAATSVSATWYAGVNSTNVSGNGGGVPWSFTKPPGKYWVGGGSSTNWDATGPTNWANSSGGANNAAVPTSADFVFLEGALPITLNATAAVRSIDCTGYTGTLTHKAGTLVGSTYSGITLQIGDGTPGCGNVALKFSSGMTYSLESDSKSAISFLSSSTTVQTVDWGGKTTGNVTFNNATGSWKYLSTHTYTTTALLSLTAGTLNTNNQTINGAQFDSTNTNNRTLILGSSTFNLSGIGNNFFIASTITNLTVPFNTATINLNRPAYGTTNAPLVFTGIKNWWFNINYSGGGIATLRGGVGSTFGSITVNGAAFSNQNEDRLQINEQCTMTGAFTLNGYSSSRRLRVHSNSGVRVMTVYKSTSVTGQYVDFSNISIPITQDLSGITGGAGDLGGNSGIIFSSGINCYWYSSSGGTKQWNDVNNWFLGSGGTGGQARIPLTSDNVIFDANSISTPGTIVNNSVEAPRIGKDVTWTGVTNNPVWNFQVDVTNYGSLTLDPNMTITAVPSSFFFMNGNGVGQTFTLTTCGVIWPHTLFRISMINSTNKVVFMDAFNGNASNTTQFSNFSGIIDFNNQNVTVGSLVLDSHSSILGNGLIKLTGTGTILNYTAFGVLSAGSSNIEISNGTTSTKTFTGNSGVYNNITISGGGIASYIFSGNNTFNDFTDSKTVAHTLFFTAGSTTTFNGNISIVGSSGNLVTLCSTTSAIFNWNKTSGIVNCDYLILSKSTAAGGATFNAGNNSINGGGNTGWNLPANNNFTWTGATNNNWSDTGNWVGGAVPGVNDTAYFTGVAVVNCTIDSGCNVKGINVGVGYTGTITLATTATIGTNGLEINGGTFTCGAQNISCSGMFKQTGGTFTNTAGTFDITSQGTGVDTWIVTGGTHNRSTGTVRVNGTSDALITNSSTRQFYHLDLNTTGIVSGTCFADGNLTRSQGSTLDASITIRLSYLGSGVGGSSAGAGTITFTGTASTCSFSYPYAPRVTINKASGVVDVPANIQIGSNWTQTAGSITWNNKKVTFENSVSGDITISNGTFYDVEIAKNNTETVTLSGVCTVANQLTMTSLANLNMTTGSVTSTIEVSGNYVNNDSSWGGTSKIVFRGSGSNTYTGSGNQGVGMEVYKTSSGSVTLFSNLNIPNSGHDLIVRSGHLNLSTYNLSVNDLLTVYGTMTLSGLSSQVITVNGTTSLSSNANFTLSATSSTIVYSDGAGTAVVTDLKKNFYNLTLGASKTHEFATGAPNATTINGRLASNGTSGTRSILRSLSNVSTDWKLTLNGTSTLADKVNVKRSDASGGLGVLAVGSINSGNNTNWVGLVTPPTITSITSSKASGTYTTAEVIPVTINFSEAITLTGTIGINLNSGGVVVISSSGTTATANYTVLAGHNSSDLTASSVVVTGTAVNGSAVALDLTLPSTNIATAKDIVIDTTAPTITSITSSTANGSYKSGDAIAIRINFSEAITLVGTMGINLDSGGVCVITAFSGTTATGTYTVLSGHASSDLTASSVVVTGTARDAVLQNLTTTLPGTNIATGSNIVIDGNVPTITSITSSTANGTYKIGDNISVRINFSEAITLVGTMGINLDSGGVVVISAFVSGTTATGTYTVASGESSSDLTASSVTVNTTARDGALNNLSTTLPSTNIATGSAIVIDGIRPTISSSTLGALNAFIDVTFSSPVYTTAGAGGLNAADFSIVFAANGGTATNATISSVTTTSAGATAGGETTLRLNLTITGTVSGTETITITPATNSSIFDLVGNAALTTTTTGAVTLQVTAGPTITNVTSSTANGSYKAGDVIAIQVTFSALVNVTGTPVLTLETGTTDQAVNYASGSGSATLVFNYTVQSGDTSSDLDYTATTALALSGGTIKNAGGTNATLTLATPGAAGSLGANKALVVDTTVPTVTGVSSSTANGTYKAGNTIAVTVTFSEAVTVVGTPTLTLETGFTDRTASYSSGSGTTILVFNYTVQAADTSSDLDYTATTSLALSGATIRDAALNDATLTLAAPGATNSLGANKAIVIDTTVPIVMTVSSSTADGAYKAGSIIAISITFSEAVTVGGVPTLTLETGATDRNATYTSGSGSTELIFSYTVQSGDTSADLDYVSTSSLALAGGSITDSSLNAATLTLASPGATNSLGAGKALVIDTTSPTITTQTLDPGLTYIDITFSEAVYTATGGSDGLSAGDFTLTFAKNGGTATGVSITGVTTTSGGALVGGETSFRLSLSVAGAIAGTETIAIAPTSSGIFDIAGNPAPTSSSTGALALVDEVGPTVTNVTSNKTDGAFKAGEEISIQIAFSEVVTVSGTPTLTLETGSTDQSVNYASGSGSTTLTFTYTVQSGDTSADLEYQSTSALALNGGSILDVASNAATLTLPTLGATGSLGFNKAIVIDTTVPTIVSTTLSPNNDFVDVTFSEAVYTTSGSGAIIPADFGIEFSANGGTATGVSITSILSTSETALVGGETTIRVFIAVAGTVSGKETITVKALSDSIFDLVGNALAEREISGTLKAEGGIDTGSGGSGGGCQYAPNANHQNAGEWVLMLLVLMVVPLIRIRK